MMERELGEGYSFIKKKCFVCGSLSHLIRDCDFYEKKMAREAELKKQRVFNTGNGVAKPVWNNANRVNRANHFIPRPVQLNTVRQNVNSVRPNVNTGRANVNSVKSNVNSVRHNVNSVRTNVNTGRSKQPVPTSNSNSFSPVRPQVNKFNQRSHFSKSHSPVRRPIVRNTARMTYSHAVKGNWGTAVKTSAGYNWRRTRPNSNYNSGSNFVRTDHPLKNMEDRGIFDSGCSGHMTGNKDHLDDFEECKGGSVTFGGSKGYITGKGRIRVGNLDFDSVSFVKELGHFNLFSISQICDKQHKVLFTETKCFVVSPDFKIPDENQILLKVPRQHNMYSFDMKTPSLTKDYACLIAKATSDESKLWHRSKLQLADALGISMLPNTEIFEGMGNIGPKSGGWDQFGSNLATALICLSTGRIYNFSKLIFDGMVANLKSKTKLFMYPRFLQMILEIQTENKHPYLAIVLTKKIFGNLKRGFRRVPRPLLPAMLPVVAVDQSAGPADQAKDQPSSSEPLPSSSHPPVISATIASEPTLIAEPTTHHTSPSPEPDNEPIEHIFEQPSPEHQPLSPRQETAVPQSQDPTHPHVPAARTMTVEDLLQLVPNLIIKVDSLETELKQTKLTMGKAIMKLVKKVKKLEDILKRRHVVLTDLEDKELEDQGRIIQDINDDPLVSKGDFVTPQFGRNLATALIEDWDTIKAKLEANAELTKEVLGKDLHEQDFAKRMVDLVFKKQKITDVPDVTKDESVKREEEFKVQQPILRYNIRKSLARKGLQKNKSESARSDTEEDVEAYMDERVDEPSSEEFQMGSIPQGSAPAKIVKWQILKTGKKGAYQIIREDHTDVVYVNFQGLLNDLTRDDLKELYRLMMLKYGDSRPEEEYERVLWGDLKTMFDPPSTEDAVWSLTHQQKVLSWRYFHSCVVHCLTLEAAHIYMLTEVKYPLPSRVCQAMLEKRLIGDRKDEEAHNEDTQINLKFTSEDQVRRGLLGIIVNRPKSGSYRVKSGRHS
ncbi:ribonuclease H-like domain-containing protein [Tanacetum coccineum]